MIGKGILSVSFKVFFITVFLLLPSQISFSEDNQRAGDCLDKAVKRMKEIITLPEIEYLHTLDGQKVWLNEFYDKCFSIWPHCSLFKKFYYWPNEIRNEVSNTKSGVIKHKIRCYYDCISAFCPESCDPKKTHGDVAEFYDGDGKFMGLAVYMGDGNYCSLPYDGYRK